MKKYHAVCFSMINPDTGKVELLPVRCARAHGGTTKECNEICEGNFSMLKGIAARMDLPDKEMLAENFSVCSLLGVMGDRAANQAAHNRWIRDNVVTLNLLPLCTGSI